METRVWLMGTDVEMKTSQDWHRSGQDLVRRERRSNQRSLRKRADNSRYEIGILLECSRAADQAQARCTGVAPSAGMSRPRQEPPLVPGAFVDVEEVDFDAQLAKQSPNERQHVDCACT